MPDLTKEQEAFVNQAFAAEAMDLIGQPLIDTPPMSEELTARMSEETLGNIEADKPK